MTGGSRGGLEKQVVTVVVVSLSMYDEHRSLSFLLVDYLAQTSEGVILAGLKVQPSFGRRERGTSGIWDNGNGSHGQQSRGSSVAGWW